MPDYSRTDKMTLSNIKAGDRLRWRHRNAQELMDVAKNPEQLERIVTVKVVFEHYLKTDFGDYFITTGCNVDPACGCKRFCNCWGKVEPMSNESFL